MSVAIATTNTSPKAFAALSVCICPGWIISKTPPANTIFYPLSPNNSIK